MRLSDILKKNQESSKDDQNKFQKPEPAKIPRVKVQNESSEYVEQKITVPKSEPAINNNRGQAIPSGVSAEEFYTKAILEIKDIFSVLQKDQDYNKDITCIDELLALINNDIQADHILLLANRTTPDVYIYGHTANVLVYAVLLGQAIGFDSESLRQLAFSAFLHDIGMAKNIAIAVKQGKLTREERQAIRFHPNMGREYIEKITSLEPEIKKTAALVAEQSHERRSGLGYPNKISEDKIHKFARIISIIDVYEALTHPRSYRERTIPHNAIKSIIESAKSEFDIEIVKAFIEKISLYPPGSYVMLNSKEIARVTGVNKGLPTRPKVRVIADSSANKVKGIKNIDLSTTPTLFIKEAVNELNLGLSDKKLSLELKASRWWVKGL